MASSPPVYKQKQPGRDLVRLQRLNLEGHAAEALREMGLDPRLSASNSSSSHRTSRKRNLRHYFPLHSQGPPCSWGGRALIRPLAPSSTQAGVHGAPGCPAQRGLPFWVLQPLSRSLTPSGSPSCCPLHQASQEFMEGGWILWGPSARNREASYEKWQRRTCRGCLNPSP